MGDGKFMNDSLSCDKGRGLLSDMGGKAKLSLLTGLLMCLATMGFLLVLNAPVQAFVTKAASCSSANCHGLSNTAAAITTSINGTVGTSITLPVSSTARTIEVDWIYTNMLTNANRYKGTSPEIAIPSGWGIGVGTANANGLSGWSATWNATDGVSWNTSYSTATEFPNSPQGYAVNYSGTPWDTGTRAAAFDDGSNTNPGDRDGTANRMGCDATITIPADTPAGTYTIMVLGIGHDANNTKAHVEQALTVTIQAPVKQTPTINSWPTASAITYGQALSSSTLTGGSASVPGTFAWVTSTTTPAVGAPPQAVRFTPTDTTAYNTVDGTVPITVNPKALTITAAAKNKVYGSVDPALTYTATALVGSDTTSGSLTRVAGENVGTYAINQGTVTAGANYTITYVGADLTVTAKPLTITAAAKSKVYGAADPALTYTSTGLVGSDTTSGSLTRVAGENAGTYAINQGSVTAGTNYTITYVGANLTINPAPLTITADAKSKEYGSADPALTYTATGLIGSDTTSGSLTRTAGENAGSYAIDQGTVSAGANYSIAYTGASLSITAKPMTITADAKSKIYGSTDPAFTYTTAGLVGSDTMSGNLTRVAGENVGTYAINQGTLSAGSNYTATYTGADLSISQKPLTITADAQSKVYGATDPALTYATTGLVGSDTLSGSLTRVAGENVGTYAINQGTLTAGSNYTAAYTSTNMTITPAPLTVTADNKTRAVGESDPVFTATYSGFISPDTAALVSGVPTFSTTATQASPAGDYPITPAAGTLSAPNYEFTTFVNGTLTITAAAGPYRLSVTVAGSGSGSVYSNDGNISCTGTTGCSYDYPGGTPVTLTVTTSSGSVFAGWSGACTGTGDCNVTMDAAKDVTVTFNTLPLARIGVTDYPTFWDAYTAATEGAVIQVRDIAVIGGSLNLPKSVTFDGGYDALWGTKTTTPVTGSMTFEQGSVTVDGMTIE